MTAVGVSIARGPVAMLVCQPGSDDPDYAAAADGLRGGGFRELTQAEFESGLWPAAVDTFVEIHAARVWQITVGRAGMVPEGRPLKAPPHWMAAAHSHGRVVLVGLLAPVGRGGGAGSD
jgi:hypothetical protein